MAHYSAEQVDAAVESMMVLIREGLKQDPSRDVSARLFEAILPHLMRAQITEINRGTSESRIAKAVGEVFGYWVLHLTVNGSPSHHEEIIMEFASLIANEALKRIGTRVRHTINSERGGHA
ncbi:hypothetical protein SAMN05216337_1001210 [Bradyrhizobium brasilense]|uniref:Uncharacterized protein n=2 Tax=Bradyrhizobium brasilense TaxID=1419277 RepID=A0A1G6IP84_9BRAD|nr:hypothetical protein SAMN05216337_1001210 [Bradyrhizobium brasilense]